MEFWTSFSTHEKSQNVSCLYIAPVLFLLGYVVNSLFHKKKQNSDTYVSVRLALLGEFVIQNVHL